MFDLLGRRVLFLWFGCRQSFASREPHSVSHGCAGRPTSVVRDFRRQRQVSRTSCRESLFPQNTCTKDGDLRHRVSLSAFPVCNKFQRGRHHCCDRFDGQLSESNFINKPKEISLQVQIELYLTGTLKIIVPRQFSFSRTASLNFGCRIASSLAVAIPTIPPPTTTTSYSVSLQHFRRCIKMVK